MAGQEATVALLITTGGQIMRVGNPDGIVERPLRAWGLVVGIVYGRYGSPFTAVFGPVIEPRTYLRALHLIPGRGYDSPV